MLLGCTSKSFSYRWMGAPTELQRDSHRGLYGVACVSRLTLCNNARRCRLFGWIVGGNLLNNLWIEQSTRTRTVYGENSKTKTKQIYVHEWKHRESFHFQQWWPSEASCLATCLDVLFLFLYTLCEKNVQCNDAQLHNDQTTRKKTIILISNRSLYAHVHAIEV